MSKKYGLGYLLIVFFLLYPLSLAAQQRNAPYSLKLRTGAFIPPAGVTHWLDSIKQTRFRGTSQVLLQFYTLPSAKDRAQLALHGIQLREYVPNSAYIALVKFPLSGNVDPSPIRSVVPVKPEWKMSDLLLEKAKVATNGNLNVLVCFDKECAPDEVLALLKKYNAQIIGDRFKEVRSFEIGIARGRLTELAAEPYVRYLTLTAQNVPLNYDGRASSGAQLLSSFTANGQFSLSGKGVTVGIGDNAAGVYHADIRDRVVNFNPAPPTTHGVHTTTTVGGRGIIDPRAEGMAPDVQLLSHFFDLVWAQTGPMYEGYNMTLTNNSYAAIVSDCNYAGTYDQYSQMLDEYGLLYPYVQHVFAAGNDGLMDCPPYPASFHTVAGGYQEAKNVLTVGGLAKDNILWPKSSRGPVNDGRLKPEIMAYSFWVYSGAIFDIYGPSNGTSMACPMVTGNLALIEERYKQLKGNNAPAALLKALAMNGATDIGNPGPDFTNGFGLINTWRSISMLDQNHYYFDSVSNGGLQTQQINIPSGTSSLKVMLYWPDDPASPMAASTLINDLDLEVRDGNGTLHLPLVLDPSPANVNNVATPGIDSRNNVEQVVIPAPDTGIYTISVKGTLVPSVSKSFVVVYDFIPQGITIKQPVGGVAIPGNDTLRIYWDASEDLNTFSLDFSADSGQSWQSIISSVPATERQYKWTVPNISTSSALLRIGRNNTAQTATTETFTINRQPKPVMDSIQCPGYFAFHWDAIPASSSYEILKKVGDSMRAVDTVAATRYVLKGLWPDSNYYAGVRPLINGKPGWRSKALIRKPNNGSCAGSISDGDLRVDSLIAPLSGRLFTSSEHSSNDSIKLRIRNLDDQPADSFRVAYQLNNGLWQNANFAQSLPALGSMEISLGGLDLAAPGIYELTVAIENLSGLDQVTANDTVRRHFRQLANDPVDLGSGFSETFESLPRFTFLKDTLGFSTDGRWDYYNSTDSGRLRSFVSSDVLITGQRSLSLDNFLYKKDNQNYLIGTFNLSAYDTASTEARLEFDYKLHGHPISQDGNEVWIRGNDHDPWLKIYTIDTNSLPGKLVHSTSLSLTHVLAKGHQNFSSSLQVRIGQSDTAVIAMNEYGNGLTIDNFRMYSVKHDVHLVAITAPQPQLCGPAQIFPTLLLYNSDNLPQDTVYIFYDFDGGAVVSDTIFALPPKDTVLHTFPGGFFAGVGTHTLNIWLHATGDTYPGNDSIMRYTFRNQRLIDSFPYLENFEKNDGGWYSAGLNNSWEYGTPSANRIFNAASGSKAWATHLSGNYNDNEQSWLYSPCFELTGLDNPVLSFSLNTDLEYCGNDLCDYAWIEYFDGSKWQKLGQQGQGYNWYQAGNVWRDTNTRWRVATIPLPKDITPLKLRFTFHSDPAASRNGIAVDDIHIYDQRYPIYNAGNSIEAIAVPTSQAKDFVYDDQIICSVEDPTAEVSKVAVYQHPSFLQPLTGFYGLRQSFVVMSSAPDSDPTTTIRLFVTDSEVLSYLKDQTCSTCEKAIDAYRLNVIQYHDRESKRENGSLFDNINGDYHLHTYQTVDWVPYGEGYYAALTPDKLSEFWVGSVLPSKINGRIIVYPNPVNGNTVHVGWSAVPGDWLHLSVTDVSGRLVFSAEDKAKDFDNITSLELPPLEAGVYFLRYKNEQDKGTVKLLIY